MVDKYPGFDISTRPVARSPVESKNQAGLVNVVCSVVRGRVESCGFF